MYLAWIIVCLWIIRLPHPLDYVRHQSTYACLQEYSSVLPSKYLFVIVRPLPVLTMSKNKALQMDLHASRLCQSVTEYSAKQGSSSFSNGNGQWLGMDTKRLLLTLKQGTRSLKSYTQEYLATAHYSDLHDCVLMDFFCYGINESLKSKLIHEGPWSSLIKFLDYALLSVGSTFTVGFCGGGTRHCVSAGDGEV